MLRARYILVVDDEQDTCANLRDILADAGYRVDVAHSGPAALGLAAQRSYDVALLDLKMPGMDGLALYYRLKELHAPTQAIMVTAYATEEAVREAGTARGLSVLSKPVDPPQLLALIADTFRGAVSGDV